AEQRLGQSLVTLMARAEAYPELKANQNFLDLQRQLKDLEDKIAYARQFYNDVVQKFNTRIETVPSNIIASLFHFRQVQYFQADEGSRQAPVVDFGQ
ncbi:MAG: LemA family protein, partial [Bifidobacterium sp.]|nr:LemA family protein [Bifidobacterium sp.]